MRLADMDTTLIAHTPWPASGIDKGGPWICALAYNDALRGRRGPSGPRLVEQQNGGLRGVCGLVCEQRATRSVPRDAR